VVTAWIAAVIVTASQIEVSVKTLLAKKSLSIIIPNESPREISIKRNKAVKVKASLSIFIVAGYQGS